MVSAIITTHNRANLLSRAINSVLNQTYQDIEIIVVSDGSTDETDKVMEGYINNPMINYISYHPAKGGNYARNTGIKVAKGEFIAFLDDDDEWLPEKIEKQLEVMKANENIGLVYTGTNVIYVDEGIEYPSIRYKCGDLSKEILFANYIGSTTTVMLRQSILDGNICFDENLKALQDYDLWIRICQTTDIGVVSKPLVNYYNYKGNKQISFNTKKYEEAFSYIHTKYQNLINNLQKREILRILANERNSLGDRAMRNGAPKIARAYYLEAVKHRIEVKFILSYICTFTSYKLLLIIKRFISQ